MCSSPPLWRIFRRLSFQLQMGGTIRSTDSSYAALTSYGYSIPPVDIPSEDRSSLFSRKEWYQSVTSNQVPSPKHLSIPSESSPFSMSHVTPRRSRFRCVTLLSLLHVSRDTQKFTLPCITTLLSFAEETPAGTQPSGETPAETEEPGK